MADAGGKISRFKCRVSLAEFRQQRDLLRSAVLTRSFAFWLAAISDMDMLVIDQPTNVRVCERQNPERRKPFSVPLLASRGALVPIP